VYSTLLLLTYQQPDSHT